MKLTIRMFAVLAAIALAVPASHAQTLTGAQAQKSPQAEAFLAYEKALIAGGLDAAAPYMTPEKLDSMKGDVKQYGEDSYKQFLDQMRRGPQGEARRKLIAKVEVKGEHAELEVRDRPSDVAVSVVPLARTKDGWKVGVRR
jgi:hypothetical protein